MHTWPGAGPPRCRCADSAPAQFSESPHTAGSCTPWPPWWAAGTRCTGSPLLCFGDPTAVLHSISAPDPIILLPCTGLDRATTHAIVEGVGGILETVMGQPDKVALGVGLQGISSGLLRKRVQTLNASPFPIRRHLSLNASDLSACFWVFKALAWSHLSQNSSEGEWIAITNSILSLEKQSSLQRPPQ